MADWDDNGEKETDGLSDIQQMQLDAIILDTAYNNAWMLLTGEITFEELISAQFSEGKELPQSGDKYGRYVLFACNRLRQFDCN